MPCLDPDRLHALLDGALAPDEARSAERHLAECAACQEARDAVARLRDDATAILSLGRVTPRRMPPFAVIAARAAAADLVAREAAPPEPAEAGEPLTTASDEALAAAITLNSGAQRRRLVVGSMAAAACVGLIVVYAARRGDEGTVAMTVASAAPSAPTVAPAEIAAPTAVNASAGDAERPSGSAGAGPLYLPVRVSFGSPASASAPTASDPATTAGPDDMTTPAVAADPRVLITARATQPASAQPAVAIMPLEAGASAGIVATDEHWSDRAAEDEEEASLPRPSTLERAEVRTAAALVTTAEARGTTAATTEGAVAPAVAAGAVARPLPAQAVAPRAASAVTPAAGDSIRARIRRSLQRPVMARTVAVP